MAAEQAELAITTDDFAQGFVDLTLTVDKLSPCEGTVSDIVRLTLNEKPVINVGTSTPTICEGETYSFAGATVTNQTLTLIFYFWLWR